MPSNNNGDSGPIVAVVILGVTVVVGAYAIVKSYFERRRAERSYNESTQCNDHIHNSVYNEEIQSYKECYVGSKVCWPSYLNESVLELSFDHTTPYHADLRFFSSA
jgi:hypothetical protein